MKLIKSIRTQRFLIALYQLENGKYSLAHNAGERPTVYSHPIDDYKLADFMFETLVQELEGM